MTWACYLSQNKIYLLLGLTEHSPIAGFGGPRITLQVRLVDERNSQLFS
jgi:hypothetical protein